MLSVGGLKEVCEHIEKEYGSDTSVVIQVYDEDNGKSLIAGCYALSYGWGDAGTLYITNQASEINNTDKD